MEVLNSRVSMLSNFEVLSFIREVKAETGQKPGGNGSQQNLLTITYEVTKHIESTPASVQTVESVGLFLEAFKNTNITRGERLMLLNHRPASTVEVHSMIEECEERMDESAVEKIIEDLQKTLPAVPEDEPEEGDASAQDMQVD